MSEAYTRSEMVDMLRNGVCQVKFIKVNGEERLMQATLKEDLIPADKKPKDDTNGVDATLQVIRCLDTEKSEWRSFKVENVLKFSHQAELFSHAIEIIENIFSLFPLQLVKSVI